MEQIVSLVREHMRAEADAGYPLLRLVPSTGATVYVDYLETVSPAERDDLLDAQARIFALGLVPTSAASHDIQRLLESNPALLRYRDARTRGPLAMGLRYESIRMARAILNDAQSVAMMRQTRSTLDYVPRDDAPVPLVNDPDVTRLNPAKAPLLKKLVKPLLQGLLGGKEEKTPGGTLNYAGTLDGTPLKVRIDFAARDKQMLYAVTIPDPERRIVLVGTTYEQLFGMGRGWDYITEENAQTSIDLLRKLLHRLVALRNEIAQQVHAG